MTSFSATIIGQNAQQMSLEDALAEVEENADKKWKNAALAQIRYLCVSRDEFTADDVWDRLDMLPVATKEPRALGAIMRRAVKEGWMRSTEKFVKSRRVESHRRPIVTWQSRLRLTSDLPF
jgi:hypothetical protein